jgi:hypothetical protein
MTTVAPTSRLRVVRPARGIAAREQALSQARAARRKLESRQDPASDRFAYLRAAHD